MMMHHMSHVRKDINKKIENSTFSQTSDALEQMRTNFLITDKNVAEKIKSGEYINVENKFGIRI